MTDRGRCLSSNRASFHVNIFAARATPRSDRCQTQERCCQEADDDPFCWEFARANIAHYIRLAAPSAATPEGAHLRVHIEALDRYSQDEGLLPPFCCSGNHNPYCWGSDPAAYLPDADRWEGVSDVTHYYSRCCFPRLRAMLRAPTPRWMERQIERDLRHLTAPGSWPSRAAAARYVDSQPPAPNYRFCDFHLRGGEVRHCNFTLRGSSVQDQKKEHRANIVARALAVLADRGELPATEVSFVFSVSDIEWEDLAVPVRTFQRGKAASQKGTRASQGGRTVQRQE